MSTSNGTTNGTTAAAASDELIDSLYSFWPGLTPAPAPCPEAIFSLTLRGTVDGHEALLTARGQTASEFKASLAAIRGLLDPPTAPQTPAPRTGQGAGTPQCPTHGALRQGKRGWFCPVKVGDTYCTSTSKA